MRKAEFAKNGYVVFKDLLSTTETDALLERAKKLASEADLSRASSFTTRGSQARDDYFLESANSVCAFVEEADNAICNKIGHALHLQDDVFSSVCASEKVQEVLESVGYLSDASPSCACIQTMIIFKHAGVGGEVAPHQDASFLYTDPPSTIALWFALEDADVDNACLWVLPGSRATPPARRFVRVAAADGATSTAFDREPTHAPPTHDAWPALGYVPLPARRGTVVAFDGHLLHASRKNESARSRIAWTMHCVKDDAQHVYPASNWLQPKDKLVINRRP